MTKSRVLGSLLVLGVAAGTAAADKSDKLFQKAKKLHGEKKYAEACPMFEEVDTIEPGIGPKLNVAKCYEDWGRLATAYRWYIDADKLAVAANDERSPKIKEMILELDTNVPRMTIRVPEGANPDVLDTLTLDGKPIAPSYLNTEQRVDPGAHVIEYVVDGRKKKKMAPVERGGESELSLDIPKGAGTKPRKADLVVSPRPDPVASPPDPGKTRRIIGISVGAGGVVMVGIAMAVTLSARGTYNDALDDHCMGSATQCDPTGLRETADARSTANKMTVLTLVGLAAIGGGVALYLTAPKPAATETAQALYVSPVVDEHGGGFVLGGSF